MTFSKDCVDLVKRFEGLRLGAYQDPGGVLTIGWGHVKGVVPGQVVTLEEAEAFLTLDLEVAQVPLHKLPKGVQAGMTQGQWDALTDWIFNLGSGNWAGSTLRERVLTQSWGACPGEILRWNHQGGRVLPGLTARREAEVELFTRPSVKEP